MSLAAATVLVPALAVAAKAAVEALTTLTYTIHWAETVPFLVVAFAFVIHAAWNERRPERSNAPPTHGEAFPPSEDARK